MTLADIFSGAVITIEHILMVAFGLAAGTIVSSRLKRIRDKLSDIERKLDKLTNGGDMP